ncbi:serine hydrolase [uncultured Paludibaculum sp.]|uniref:serine hydrolase domain-containing protein n=1 Tax=uncultured Paludibaculum sp. TaxID=1765020 RepID=UPI002AABA2D4|nr:serine hydrolase [uncultured Paludibaculum sp.]
MDLDRLDQAFRYTATTSQHGGLLVVRHGWLLYERYFGRAARDVTPNMYSIGKTVTSLCCGIMLDEHRNRLPKGLDQAVFAEPYLPEAFPLADARQSGIKLGHLLTMTSGMREGNSGIVRGEFVKLDAQPPAVRLDQDQAALRAPMWTDAGGGYSYTSQGVHVASILLRHITGMELQAHFEQKIAKPVGFGGWGYAMDTAAGRLPHTPGGAGVALRATDALRYGYLMLREGNWMGKQLVPREYMSLCRRPSPYNPHSPYSLQFEVNADGHVFGAPSDTFFKSGAGGFCLYVVPSLDLIVYKLASVTRPGAASPAPYDLGFGGTAGKSDESRDKWAPPPADQFHDGPINGDAGTRRTLEMVIAAIVG